MSVIQKYLYYLLGAIMVAAGIYCGYLYVGQKVLISKNKIYYKLYIVNVRLTNNQ